MKKNIGYLKEKRPVKNQKVTSSLIQEKKQERKGMKQVEEKEGEINVQESNYELQWKKIYYYEHQGFASVYIDFQTYISTV